MINETTENLKNGKYDIKQSDEVKEAMIELRRYMFKNIYLADVLKEERGKAKFILTHVIDYFINIVKNCLIFIKKLQMKKD